MNIGNLKETVGDLDDRNSPEYWLNVPLEGQYDYIQSLEEYKAATEALRRTPSLYRSELLGALLLANSGSRYDPELLEGVRLG